MGEPQTKYEVGQLIGKAMMWLAYAAIGVIGKLAFDSNNTKLTKRKIFIKSVLSIVVGIISGLACEAMNEPKWEKFVIPVATLLGESITLYFMTDFKDILERFLPSSKKSINHKK